MILFSILVEALGVTLGSLAIAAIFCWLCWTLFKCIHHPELGVPLALAVMFLLFRGEIGKSELLQMAAIFAASAAVPLWFVGRDRGKIGDANLPAIIPVPAHSRAKWHYPAIIACVGEGHVPNRAQVRRVAKRIRREVYPAIRLDVALRRRISHAALIALGVDQD